MSEPIDMALGKAQEVLRRECSLLGLMASPEGYPHQAWSAGMYAYAYRCVTEGRVPVFDSRAGW